MYIRLYFDRCWWRLPTGFAILISGIRSRVKVDTIIMHDLKNGGVAVGIFSMWCRTEDELADL